MKKLTTLFSILASVTLLLSLIRVVMVNSISTTGIELGQVQDQIKAMQQQNTLIHEKILEEASLTNISEKAQKLGFVPSTTEMNLSDQLPLALKQ